MTLEDIKSIDSQNMWEFLTTFPEQWKEAVERTKDIELNIDDERISNICFAGMGGLSNGC